MFAPKFGKTIPPLIATPKITQIVDMIKLLLNKNKVKNDIVYNVIPKNNAF